MSTGVVRLCYAKAHGLTERMLEVLEGYSQGCNSREIGLELGVSHMTVHRDKRQILYRLNAKNIAQAVRVGFRNGFLQ